MSDDLTEARDGGRTAVVAGGSGLVGRELIRGLLDDPVYGRVVALLRWRMDVQHPKLEQRLVDFGRPDTYADSLSGAHDVFCCLGTTIRKAGSQEAFRLVDEKYPLTLAGFAREAGAETFLIVSAMGANPSSRMFYNRVKGTVERELRRIGLPRTYVFRPSLLLGRREEFRAGERVAVALAPLLSPLLTGPFAKYRPIAAADVATAMRLAARSQRQDEGDWTVFESDAIARLARSGG